MKVEGVTSVQSFLVTTDDDENSSYERYGPDLWFVVMGQSSEPVYNCADIERSYQEFIRLENCSEDDEGDWDVERDDAAQGGASAVKDERANKAIESHIRNKENSNED